MGFLFWLLIGFVAGAIAKAITPQQEKGGWISSIIIGIIGSFVGGFLANLLGIGRILGGGLLGSLIIATLGALLVLWIYHRYLADKLNLPV